MDSIKCGELLVKLRREQGIYQKVLATELNVSIGTISNYENGVHNPDLETLCNLADYFNVSTDFLLQRTKYRHSLETLNKKVVVDYTTADLVNTTLELTPRNRKLLFDYLELLDFRNKYEKNEADQSNGQE